MVCGKYIGHRGFCSEKCHNEFYDSLPKPNKALRKEIKEGIKP